MKARTLTFPLPLFFPEGRDRPRRQGPIHILCFPRGVTVDLGLMEYSARALRAAGRHEGVVLTEDGDVAGPLTQSEVDALLNAVEDGSINKVT
jgi:hypothetical protein